MSLLRKFNFYITEKRKIHISTKYKKASNLLIKVAFHPPKTALLIYAKLKTELEQKTKIQFFTESLKQRR